MNNELSKARFFGQCLGMRVMNDVPHLKSKGIHTLDVQNFATTIYNKTSQIIGRRISQMTDEENKKFNGIVFSIIRDDSDMFSNLIETLNYLNSIGVFPDKYFESQNGQPAWVVEEEEK